eukprot:symbB.v1.2.013140.t3/scaffold925.1/size151535/7
MVPPKSAFPPEGTRFGLKDDNFELGQELGGGSQGRVFACKRLGTGNEYAVKVVNTKAISLRERTVASLRREIGVMRELHHPRIVNLKEAYSRCLNCSPWVFHCFLLFLVWLQYDY